MINVTEVLLRRHTPLLPAIYFDSASATLPERYAHLSTEGADAFGYADVAGLNEFQLAHHVLDMVGFRLRQYPSTSVVVHASTSGDEPRALAADRLATVRSYLEHVWRIAPDRIDTSSDPDAAPSTDESSTDESTADGREENRRVTFSSPSPDLLAPIGTQRLSRRFDPPRIRLEPTYGAEAGVRAWRIDVMQNGDTVVSFSNHTDSTDAALTWHLSSDRIDSTLGTLAATLTVVDSAGQSASARDSISLRVARDTLTIDSVASRDGELVRIDYPLVGFGYRSARGDASHELRIRELAAMIRPDAQITVTGYTDRVGTDAVNLELSRQRAQFVANRLAEALHGRGLDSIRANVVAGGVETDRFSNDLPEGRALSRGAVVTILQREDVSQ